MTIQAFRIRHSSASPCARRAAAQPAREPRRDAAALDDMILDGANLTVRIKRNVARDAVGAARRRHPQGAGDARLTPGAGVGGGRAAPLVAA